MADEKNGEPVKEEQSHSIGIDAPADACYRVICNFESYPEFMKMCKSVKTLVRYPDGRPKTVEFVIDAIYRDFQYVLEYYYDDERHVLRWKLVGGDIKASTGSYTFEPLGENKTHATYSLYVDSGVPIPRRFANLLGKVEMRRSMKYLKNRIESKL